MLCTKIRKREISGQMSRDKANIKTIKEHLLIEVSSFLEETNDNASVNLGNPSSVYSLTML